MTAPMAGPETTPVAGAAPASAYPPATRARATVVVLWLLFTLNFVDRQILSLLVEPIKADLGLSDTEFGILAGWTFAIFFSLAGFPAARLADKGDRRLLIAAGVTVWSVATAACGLARSFWQMFAARVCVGVGEAALTPAATSLIADSYPPAKRGRAMAVFSLGIPMGSALAFVIGGTLVGLIGLDTRISLPLVGLVRGWQIVFFLVGLPGIFLAATIFLTRDPGRRGAPDQGSDAGLRETLGYFRRHGWLYGLLYGGLALQSALGYMSSTWLPAFFLRIHGLSEAVAGQIMGGLLLVFGIGGILVAGTLVDRYTAKGHPDAPVRVLIYGLSLGLIPGLIFPLMPSVVLACLFLSVTMFAVGFGWGIAFTAAAAISPSHFRAQATALYVFAANLVGYGLGPPLIGLFNDYVFGSEQMIDWSFVCATAILAPGTLILLLASRKRFAAQAAAVAKQG